MWEILKKILGVKTQDQKYARFYEIEKDLHQIDGQLNQMSMEFTQKNEIHKSVCHGDIYEKEVKTRVKEKFIEFQKSYSERLLKLLDEKEVLEYEKSNLMNDSDLIFYDLKKSFLSGSLKPEIYLEIMDKVEKAKNPQNKVATVMREFHSGKLKTGNGDRVTDRDQALAIAMSEAGLSKAQAERMKDDPCWSGYEMVGQKDKDGKEVPNCVKKAEHGQNISLEGIAKKHKVAPEFVQKQLRMGVKKEMEHTKDKAEARKIALDHLSEIHDYYTRLEDLEGDHERDMEEMNKGEKHFPGETKKEYEVHEKKESPKREAEEHEPGGYEHKQAKSKKEFEQKEKEFEDKKPEMKKADYYHPNDSAEVNGDMEENKRSFVDKGFICSGFNCAEDGIIDRIDFQKAEIEDFEKAEHEGKSVQLGKPMPGDSKKYKVYVKNDKGNVVKVEFGDPNMEIKRDNPERRRSFRARHKCDQAKDRTSAGYWSCKMWSKTPVSKITKSLEIIDALFFNEDIDTFKYNGLIEKAKAGVYADNEYNRKLGRVGEKYGEEKEKKDGKRQPAKVKDEKPKKEAEEKPTGTGKVSTDEETEKLEKPTEPVKVDVPNQKLKKLKEQAKAASAEDLQATVKRANDPELRAVAQEELDRRKNEEIATKAVKV